MQDLPLKQCYELLELRPGASIEQIDAAFARQSIERFRQGSKEDKALLKAAYHRLKDHALLQQAEEQTERNVSPLADQIEAFLRDRFSTKNIEVEVREREDTIQICLQSKTNIPETITNYIQKYLKSLALPEEHTIAVYGMRSAHSVVWKKQFKINEEIFSEDDRDPFSANNRIITVIAFPITMGFALLMNSNSIFRFLWNPMHIWVHEFGHATVAWLSGRRAIPLPFGWTNYHPARSLFVYFGVLTLFGLLAWVGRREKKPWAIGLAIALAILQFIMTWIFSPATFTMLFSFGGIGGEFYLSTLLMLSFYFRLPEYWRWDFWRYLVSIAVAPVLWSNVMFWRGVRRGTESIPWGSMLFGEGDSGGDMNQLSEVYGWSDLQIINTYNAIGNVCLFVLVSVYIFFLLKHRRWLLSVIARS